MNLRQFHSDAMAALAAEPNRHELERISDMASNLAEMVGWAPDIIDPRGEVCAVLEGIRSSAGQLYDSKSEWEVAIFHDSVAGLMDAISGHDRDLEPGIPGDGEILDSW
ncbi:MAG TPA: hypothetical protein VKB27_20550 [Gammaproteobacteria bacterium]|nr:hypothetical protein [Gammaproteobacteria bacterium]